MIGEAVDMRFIGGQAIRAQNVSTGHTLLGLAGATPRPMLVRSTMCKKEPEAIAVYAEGHVATFSPDTVIFCHKTRRRADELAIGDIVRIFDDILCSGEVSSLEHLEGGFRMFDFNCDGIASYLVAGGFLVR